MDKGNVYNWVTERIIDSLNKGVIPWKKPWIAVNPRNIKGREYSGINRLLLGFTNHKFPIFLTFRQCKDIGGSVNAGAKSHLAVFWKIIPNAETSASDKKSKKTGGIPLLRYYNVFNIEDTDIPMEKIGLNLEPIEFHDDPLDRLMGIIKTEIPEIRHNAEKAFYSPSSDYISMPHPELFRDREEYVSVLIHELIHSTGHKNRLNREIKNSYGDENYSKEELVAEIGSSFLCNMLGIVRVFDNSVAYIASWKKRLKDDPHLIVSASGMAEKAVKFLTGEKNENPVE